MRVVRPLGKMSFTACFTNDFQQKCHCKALISLCQLTQSARGVPQKITASFTLLSELQSQLFHRCIMSEISLQIPSHRPPRDAPMQFQTRGIQGTSNILQAYSVSILHSWALYSVITSVMNIKCYFVRLSKYKHAGTLIVNVIDSGISSDTITPVLCICVYSGYVQRADDGDPRAELQPHDHEGYLL